MSENENKKTDLVDQPPKESVKLSSAIGSGLKYTLYFLIIYYGLKWTGVLGWLGIE